MEGAAEETLFQEHAAEHQVTSVEAELIYHWLDNTSANWFSYPELLLYALPRTTKVYPKEVATILNVRGFSKRRVYYRSRQFYLYVKNGVELSESEKAAAFERHEEMCNHLRIRDDKINQKQDDFSDAPPRHMKNGHTEVRQ